MDQQDHHPDNHLGNVTGIYFFHTRLTQRALPVTFCVAMNSAIKFTVCLWVAICNLSASSLKIPERIKGSVCFLRSPVGSGTGTILSKDGLVATNAHVLSDINLKLPKPRDVYLECNGKKLRTKEIVYLNHQEDLALLRLRDKSVHYISLSRNSPQIGDTISIIGFPADSSGGVHRRALTEGVIDRIHNDVGPFKNKIKIFRTDATTGPGSSGSPVLLKGLFAGIIYSGGKENKNDFHGKSFAIGSDVVKRAIDHIRWSSKKARELPSIKTCKKQKTRGCSKRAHYLWNRGHAYQALSVLQGECKKGFHSDCSFAKKMSAIIKEVKAFRKVTPSLQVDGDKDKFFEYVPPASEEEGRPVSLVEKFQQLSTEIKIILIVTLLIIFVLCLRRISLFLGDSIISPLKKEKDKKINDYFKVGTRIDYLPLEELKENTPLRGIINKVRQLIYNLERSLGGLSKEFEKKMATREKSDDNARDRFDNMYIKQKKIGYKVFGLTLLLLEGLSVGILLNLNFRQLFSEADAYFYSVFLALFFVAFIQLLKKVQHKFWHHTFKLYLMILIPALSVLFWRIVEGRTGSGVENLLTDPLFVSATMLTAILGALVVQFYPGTPQQQDECTSLIKNMDEQKKLRKSIKNLKDFLNDIEQDNRSVKDIVIEGVRYFIARLKHSKSNRENYVKEIEKRISSSPSSPTEPSPSIASSTIKIMPHNHIDNDDYNEPIH